MLKIINKIIVLLCLMLLASCSSSNSKSLAPPHAPLIEGETVPVLPHPNMLTLLNSRDSLLAENKRLVFDMWRTIFNAGHVEMADQFLSANYQEHSIIVPTGREAFKTYHAERIERLPIVPTVIIDPVVSIIAEGAYVGVVTVEHYYEPDDSGDTYTSSHFDLFRITQGRIAEHWDSAQISKGSIPPTLDEGGPLPIVGLEELAQYSLLGNDDFALANNKRLVFDLWRHTSEGGREEAALLYLDPIYIQHNPNAVTGREGFMEYFSKRPETPVETYLEAPLIAMLAEGDIVMQALQGERPDPNNPGEVVIITWFDMFRIQNGRLIEHWDTASKGEVPKIMEEQFKR